MSLPRLSGILLHPTSLPSRGPIGDFGPAAYDFVDFLSAARQGLWQVLPLGPSTQGNSPYSSLSAFAGNPLLISLERLAERGWIPASSLDQFPAAESKADYDRAAVLKLPLLQQAAKQFLSAAASDQQARYQKFVEGSAWWLEDFALFEALRERYQKISWKDWPPELARREPEALEVARAELKDEIASRCVIQFFFFEQWSALHRYCAERSVRLVGDISIFVDHDSADVWSQPKLWRLKEDLEPEVVSGVPPDAFSATGQRWGNPLYDWKAMHADGYRWWVKRLRWATQNFDFIRLDHFRGFAQFWEIPAAEPTAVNGRWVDGPRDELFQTLREELGRLPFFAEDLGYITPDVHELRKNHGIPGMAVLQFAFGNPGAHGNLPHQLKRDSVLYTGTHDNDTTLGWFHSSATDYEKRAVLSYTGDAGDTIHWALIRAAEASPANFCVVPVQDVLGLNSDARMNMPSVSDGNFRWRMNAGALTATMAEKLAALAEVTDRVPPKIVLSEIESDFAA
ncbi:MAG TPA: 4-alpha-glucanotransferase [Terriglobales bacterium]